MTCSICRRGTTAPGETSVVLERENAIVIVRGVPAEICDECGEYYLSETVGQTVLDLGEAAIQRGAEVEIVRYAA
jgi:YgiT-type zinc finger domain-containing protein